MFGKKYSFEDIDGKPSLSVRRWNSSEAEVFKAIVRKDGDAFSGKRIEDFRVEHFEKRNMSMSGSALDGVTFYMSNLCGVNFSGSHLHNVNFSHCNLYEANFSGAVLTGCIFEDCTLPYSVFDGAVLEDSRFMGGSVRAASFNRVLFGRGVMFIAGADITRTDFSGSHIENMDFSCAFNANDYLIRTNQGILTTLKADALDDEELEAAILVNGGVMPEPTFVYHGDAVLDAFAAASPFLEGGSDYTVVIPTVGENMIDRARASVIRRYATSLFGSTMDVEFEDRRVVIKKKTAE